MNWKKDWETKLWDEFQDCEWDEIRDLIQTAYKKAIGDKDGKHEYTHLVMFNLRMLAKHGIEKITFKQWKSFRAYIRIENEIIEDKQIEKLFNNENKIKA
jgi:hypothetical protein